MSATRSGVASIAKYWRFHLIAPRTGKLDSIAATCIATAASIPGATKSRYGMPSGCAPRLTNFPSPTPSAVRYSTGLRTLVMTVPRQTRR